MKTFLDCLKIFVPVFLFFVAVGAVAGYNGRQGVVEHTLVTTIDVKQQKSAYVLEHYCAINKLTFVHSIDDNTGEYVADLQTLAALQETALELPDARITEYTALIGGILGGVTGGFKLQSVLKKPAQGWTWSHIRKSVIGIIGSISGYYTGYRIGSHYDTDCDSNFFNSVLGQPEVWTRLERAILSVKIRSLQNLEGARISQTGQAINLWETDPAFMCSTRLQHQKERLNQLYRKIIKEPTSEHFRMIDSISSLHGKISRTPEYRTLVRLMIYKHSGKFGQFDPAQPGLGNTIKERQLKWDATCSALRAMTL